MISIFHKILIKGNETRSLEKFTIYNNSLFRKKIKYLFIGLNPSAENNEFTDKTNLWIINWIIKKDNSGGYYLTNLFKNISSTACKSKKTKNDILNNVIKKYKKLHICVFYGAGAVSDGEVKIDEKSIEILKRAFNENRLSMTSQNGKFHHISMSSSSLEITPVDNLKKIGL